MLSIVQTKTLDALEYALQVIEQFDKEFSQKVHQPGNKENKKDDQGDSNGFEARFSDVKASCQTLFALQKDRAINFVSGTTVFKLADEKVDFSKRYTESIEFTSNMYKSFNTQIVVPLQENVVFMYDTSWAKACLIVKNLQNSAVSQLVTERFANTKVTLTQNFMRLDFDQDGKVTMTDIISALNSIKEFLAQYQLIKDAIELPQTFRQKALGYIQSEKSAKNGEVEKRLNSASSNGSNESIELNNLNEKDD